MKLLGYKKSRPIKLNCLIELIAKIVKQRFNVKLQLRSNQKSISISLEELNSVLLSLGIQQGDSIMVHSSFRCISASATEVITMLQELVGENGNILMPTHPDLMRDEKGLLHYDPVNSPSTVGYLTECFRQMPNVERSIHPFSSIAVWGKDKKWFLENNISGDAPLPHGIHSPYVKFASIGGKTVCIGVKAKKRGTILHCAEEVLDDMFPLNIFENIDVAIEDENITYNKKFRRTALSFSQKYMCQSKIENEWKKNNILISRKVHNIPIEVLDAKKCIEVMTKNILQGEHSYPYAPSKLYNVKY
jgi:aminoglycoside 3-N-acetyltransferase